MSSMSTGTIAYPRSRARSGERSVSRATASPGTRKGQRAPQQGRKSARDAGRARSSASRARASVSERADRGAKRGRENALGFVSRHRAPLAVVAALLLLVLFFYGPVKGLYQAWRTEGIRQAQLSGLTEENDSYQQDIDRLQTREGVEDEARRRGYVAERETSIVVEGLDASEDAQEESTSETPWYLRVTDTIFQYEEP